LERAAAAKLASSWRLWLVALLLLLLSPLLPALLPTSLALLLLALLPGCALL
jgi:hypothetical protein